MFLHCGHVPFILLKVWGFILIVCTHKLYHGTCIYHWNHELVTCNNKTHRLIYILLGLSNLHPHKNRRGEWCRWWYRPFGPKKKVIRYSVQTLSSQFLESRDPRREIKKLDYPLRKSFPSQWAVSCVLLGPHLPFILLSLFLEQYPLPFWSNRSPLTLNKIFVKLKDKKKQRVLSLRFIR